MNSAIIGDSPIMLILANHLKNKEQITIYTDKDRVGGAWSYIKFQNQNISRQTNVVVPINEEVEKFQSKINNSLLKYNVKIEKAQGFHKPNFYLAKQNFKYDFNGLFETLNELNVINKSIKQISVHKNFFKLNNINYDKIYIPYFNGIKKIRHQNDIFDIAPKVITSKHILLIFKKLPIKEFIYTENFDDVFDRAQITMFKDFVSFTARVRLENKNKQIRSLLKKSKINKYVKSDNLIFSNILKYQNYFRNSDDIANLIKVCRINNIEVINTFQFFEAYLDLNERFLHHF